jgi:hypothetical protein
MLWRIIEELNRCQLPHQRTRTRSQHGDKRMSDDFGRGAQQSVFQRKALYAYHPSTVAGKPHPQLPEEFA